QMSLFYVPHVLYALFGLNPSAKNAPSVMNSGYGLKTLHPLLESVQGCLVYISTTKTKIP
ncbi:hypothetical protein OFO29_35620, partial [Escherichia coli]|nr:hypothetical protein [Escherichia coli]